VTLTEALLVAAGSAADQRSVCRSIDQRVEDLRRRCYERVYAATLGEEESEELVSLRRDALDSLVGMAFHARDWPRLEGRLARVAAEDLPATWARIVDFTHGEYCPQFVAAFERGIEWFEEWHAERLADTLRECGEEERARRLVERAGLLRQDGSDATSTPGVEWLRGGSCPFGPDSLPSRRWFSELADDPSGRLRAAYERWTREEPRNGCAWLGLATLVERAGDADGALAAWRAASELAPANLDLGVAFGAAALRLERPAGVREAADRLRRHPAAVPRHHAEADYLLGRLARRQGRWEEASDLLSSYFLRRIGHARCPPPCDGALLIHLVAAGHGERLARYLAARTALVAARPVREEAAAEHPWRRDPPGEVADEVAEISDVDEEDLPDPEPLFPDDELLHLGWSLRDVDSLDVVVTRRW
jgi:tetratricopeptide (TPR) repeat protein